MYMIYYPYFIASSVVLYFCQRARPFPLPIGLFSRYPITFTKSINSCLMHNNVLLIKAVIIVLVYA